MKIISLYWGYSLGGVGKYGVLFNQAAKKAGYEIINLCIRGENWQTDFPTLKQLDAKEIVIKSRLDISWFGKLIKIFEKEQPNFLITHGFNGHFASFITNKFSTYKPIYLASYHGLYHATTRARKPLEGIFNRFTEYYLRNKVSSVVVVANYSRHYLVTKNVNIKNINVIHNGIDDAKKLGSKRYEIRNEWGIQHKDSIVLGVASRIDPVKGIKYLITAFESFLDKYQHIYLVIIGIGTEKEALESLVKQKKLDHWIIFAGFRSDISDCLEAFDVFLLPSLAEYHSIALLEAMRAEKPIISTDVGGNTESVRDKQEALIVPPADSKAISGAIDLLLKDSQLSANLAQGARKRFLEEFTVGRMVEKTANWLSSLDK